MNKVEIIKSLVGDGRVPDLLLMLEGESPYTNEESEGVPKDKELAKLWMAALYHLRFVAKFGNLSDTVMDNGRWVSAFPTEFAEWMDAGAPGISIKDLNRYLIENPL